jgi:hypothetical protein
LLSLNASGQIIFCKPRSRILWAKRGIYRLLIDFMSPSGTAPWRPERFCSTALSASTGVTAPDKVDRLEARTAFRAAEPDAQPEAVAEPGGPQAAGVAAEPGAP